MRRNALLCLFVLAAFVASGGAMAQKLNSRGGAPIGGGPSYGGGGNGWGAAVPGIIMAIPQFIPRRGEAEVIDDQPRRSPQRQSQRGASGAPPANERRYVPDEVVIELANSVTPQQVNALQTRFRLTRLESQTSALTGTTLYRWRIPDRRSVATVVRALENDGAVASAQPNYMFTLQQSDAKADAPKAEGDPAQYELGKLHLREAHAVATGDGVLVAVVDSGVDASHPELAGSVTASFDAVASVEPPNKHGTSIAGLIAAHGRLTGSAPAARIVAVRAFGTGGDGTTFGVLKGLEFAVTSGARVINMSFAGPADPITHRALAAAYKKGIVLVAAAGNAGAKSPPLYPAAYPEVIAVSATDADDKIFAESNRGPYIAIAAPGADVFVAIPNGGYEINSGTSYSAAEISGIAALMLQRDAKLTPEKVRAILSATATDIGPKGRDIMFGAGLADAYRAITAGAPVVAAQPGERASNGTR